MKNFLVTGCAGFIGSHLCEFLLAKGCNVTGIDNFDRFYPRNIKESNLTNIISNENFSFLEIDLCNMPVLSKIHLKAECVIHLAAKAGVRPSIEHPQDYINANIVATQNVLDFMRMNKISKYVFASSSSVYGNNSKVPFDETDEVKEPISPYASTKRAGELINYTYHYLYQIDTVNLRLFTVYGPRQRPDLAIRKFVNLLDKGDPIEMYGDGSTSRDYTFITDIINGIYAACQYLDSNRGIYEIINLGNNVPVSLKEMINTIAECMEVKPEIIQKPLQPGEVQTTFASIDKASRLLGYKPQTRFKYGISKFWEWHQNSELKS